MTRPAWRHGLLWPWPNAGAVVRIVENLRLQLSRQRRQADVVARRRMTVGAVVSQRLRIHIGCLSRCRNDEFCFQSLRVEHKVSGCARSLSGFSVDVRVEWSLMTVKQAAVRLV